MYASFSQNLKNIERSEIPLTNIILERATIVQFILIVLYTAFI